jgi:hypothetical protein
MHKVGRRERERGRGEYHKEGGEEGWVEGR